MMSKIVRKICPITGIDEIVITYLEPEELVVTQHKTAEGKFEKVLKPRKEVKNGLLPNAECPHFQHPLLTNLPESSKAKMRREGKIWCKKIGKICPLEDFTHETIVFCTDYREALFPFLLAFSIRVSHLFFPSIVNSHVWS